MNYYTIGEYLKKKNIAISLTGFRNLSHAIMLKYNNNHYSMMSLYTIIAEQTKTPVASVERTMRHAIKKAGHNMPVKEFVAQAVYDLTYGAESGVC